MNLDCHAAASGELQYSERWASEYLAGFTSKARTCCRTDMCLHTIAEIYRLDTAAEQTRPECSVRGFGPLQKLSPCLQHTSASLSGFWAKFLLYTNLAVAGTQPGDTTRQPGATATSRTRLCHCRPGLQWGYKPSMGATSGQEVKKCHASPSSWRLLPSPASS